MEQALQALSSESKPYKTKYPDIIGAYAHAASGHGPRLPFIYRLPQQVRPIFRRARRAGVRSPGWANIVLALLGGLFVFLVQTDALRFEENYDLLRSFIELKDIKFRELVNATTYFAAAALLVGGYSAWVISKQNQANFVKDYNLKFLEQKEIYESWRYLFYLYKNSDFQNVDDAIKNYIKISSASDQSGGKLTFDLIKDFNKDREELGPSQTSSPSAQIPSPSKLGLRRWHPRLLPESPEEERIDKVLSYFNVLGDYYERGSLSLDEIGDVATFHLRAIGNSEAFRAYLVLLMEVFASGDTSGAAAGEKAAVRERYGYPPFGNLCLLLRDLEHLRGRKEPAFYRRYHCHVKMMRLKAHFSAIESGTS